MYGIHLSHHIRSKSTDRHGPGGPQDCTGETEPHDPCLGLGHHRASCSIPLALLGNIWQTAANCAVIAALLLINWKEDALNAFFAKRKALPGTDCADTTFFPDCFLVKTAAAESKWQYDKILALAETVEYLVLVMGKNYALAVEKATLAGGSLPGFRRFLEEQSGQNIQNIGG